jgi:hypothetical protein
VTEITESNPQAPCKYRNRHRNYVAIWMGDRERQPKSEKRHHCTALHPALATEKMPRHVVVAPFTALQSNDPPPPLSPPVNQVQFQSLHVLFLGLGPARSISRGQGCNCNRLYEKFSWKIKYCTTAQKRVQAQMTCIRCHEIRRNGRSHSLIINQ